jgi:hypothetical protein
MTKPQQPMRKYGNVEPTESERIKNPLADRKPARAKEREAREDGIRRPLPKR